jgi:hypothetical protein
MKLRALTYGTLAASTVVFAATVVSPAEAASVTGTLNFAKDSGVNSITNTKVDFVNRNNFFSVGNSSTGTFAGLRGEGVTILRDLTLPFTGAFDFLRVDNGTDDIVFNITGLGSTSLTSTPDFSTFSANVFGNFVFGGDTTAAKPGSFIVALDSSDARFTNISIKSSADAVPTPALLPALVGMGIAAVRKRKSAEPADA